MSQEQLHLSPHVIKSFLLNLSPTTQPTHNNQTHIHPQHTFTQPATHIHQRTEQRGFLLFLYIAYSPTQSGEKKNIISDDGRGQQKPVRDRTRQAHQGERVHNRSAWVVAHEKEKAHARRVRTTATAGVGRRMGSAEIGRRGIGRGGIGHPQKGSEFNISGEWEAHACPRIRKKETGEKEEEGGHRKEAAYGGRGVRGSRCERIAGKGCDDRIETGLNPRGGRRRAQYGEVAIRGP